MKRKEYNKIEGAWKEKEIAYLSLQDYDNPIYSWCVTEKVHGSNMSLYTDGVNFKAAKRNSFLVGDKDFCNFSSIRDSLKDKLEEMWYLVSYGMKRESLIVYGEIFGGYYDHPEVKKLSNVKRVQKGIYYAPDINFYCYDIMLDGKFLNMIDVIELCEKTGIFYAKIIFKGSFDECLEFDYGFQSKISGWLGLPVIEDNLCEGVVLKPITPLYYKDGNRVILKRVNKKFKGILQTSKEIKEEVKLSEYAMTTLKILSLYINENRLRNVLSKIGSFTMKDYQVVFNAFKKDIYEDFNSEQDDLSIIDKIEKREIDKVVGKLCTQVWRPIFLVEAER